MMYGYLYACRQGWTPVMTSEATVPEPPTPDATTPKPVQWKATDDDAPVMPGAHLRFCADCEREGSELMRLYRMAEERARKFEEMCREYEGTPPAALPDGALKRGETA